jgi:type VI secretion system protein ImpA
MGAMAGLNFADLAGPLSPDEPCGPDLEDDLDFQNVVARLEVALPGSYFRRDDEGRQVAFDKSGIDFNVAFADLGKMLARSRDLRLLVLAAKYALLNRDVAGFSAALGLAADLLGTQWDAVHPRPMDGDAILREVALQSLDDMATAVLPLQHAPLFVSRRIGPLAFRSQLVASGETRLVDGEQHPDAGTIQAAIGDVNLEELIAARDRIAAAQDALRRIGAVWAEKTGAMPLQCPRLSGLLDQISVFLNAGVARRAPGQASAPQAAESSATPASPGVAQPMAQVPAGDCASVSDVRRSLAACLAYFRRTEPSSPAVLLIAQASDLIGKSLFEVIQAMFPEHVERAAIELGQSVRFHLPLERLASLEGAGPGEPFADEPAAEDDWPQEQEGGEEDSGEEDSGQEDDGDDESAGSRSEAGNAGGADVAPAATRGEAIAMMGSVARFYRRVEPSHPMPLLLDKACLLAQQDFVTLLGAILPDIGLPQQTE